MGLDPPDCPVVTPPPWNDTRGVRDTAQADGKVNSSNKRVFNENLGSVQFIYAAALPIKRQQNAIDLTIRVQLSLTRQTTKLSNDMRARKHTYNGCVLHS